jgi:hypothetical protein
MMCTACGRQVSVTAGTIFDKTRTPLKVWFAAAWYFTSEKSGMSARRLQRLLDLGSYQTAWTLVHRFRRAMVRVDHERLSGTVQIDATHVILGNRDLRLVRGSPSYDREMGNLLIVVAAEMLQSRGIGRVRLKRIPSASQEHVQPFVEASVDPSALIETGGSPLYSFLLRGGYGNHRTVVHDAASRTVATLPVKRIAALLRRWLLATHDRAAQPSQLDHHLEEFVFRFNRRTPRSRGLLFYRLLEQAVQCGPVRYRDVVRSHPRI